jgi:hypothetical protein
MIVDLAFPAGAVVPPQMIILDPESEGSALLHVGCT